MVAQSWTQAFKKEASLWVGETKLEWVREWWCQETWVLNYRLSGG